MVGKTCLLCFYMRQFKDGDFDNNFEETSRSSKSEKNEDKTPLSRNMITELKTRFSIWMYI